MTADDFIFTWEMAMSPQNTVATLYPYDRFQPWKPLIRKQ